MNKIIYVKGDATKPQGLGTKIITHICNDVGLWGKGFVLAISKRWKLPENQYKQWYKGRKNNNFKLGQIQLVKVQPTCYVSNMIAQRGIYEDKNHMPPIRYEAVQQCLKKLSKQAKKLEASVHMPRIGCGLAGGKWQQIQQIIQRTLIKQEIKTCVYDFI